MFFLKFSSQVVSGPFFFLFEYLCGSLAVWGPGVGEETSCFQEALEGQGATTIRPRRGFPGPAMVKGGTEWGRPGSWGSFFFFFYFLGGRDLRKRKGQKNETTAN